MPTCTTNEGHFRDTTLKPVAIKHSQVAAEATKASVGLQIECCLQPLISWPVLMILPNG